MGLLMVTSALPIARVSVPSRVVRDAVFVFGKICLLLSVAAAWHMGTTVGEMGDLELPALSLPELESQDAPTGKPTFEEYRAIINANIFGYEATKAPPTNIAPPTQKSSLDLRLVGTNIQPGTTPFAIIEDKSKKNQELFDLNENIFGKAKLIEINPENVRIEVGGRIETLVLEEGSPSLGGDSAGGVSSDGQDSFSVAEAELNEALSNLPRLLSQARAVPYFRNGKSIGMRLFAIRRGSLYEKLGLKNGDIIKSVNENSLSDPSQALKIFEQLKNEREVFVELERKAEDKKLSYTIR